MHQAAHTPMVSGAVLKRTVSYGGTEKIEESSETVSRREEKTRQLKGLIGIYSGHGDRRANWWGLLPIHSDCPCPITPPHYSTAETTVPFNSLDTPNSNTSNESVHPMAVTPLVKTKHKTPAVPTVTVEPVFEQFTTIDGKPLPPHFINAGECISHCVDIIVRCDCYVLCVCVLFCHRYTSNPSV